MRRCSQLRLTQLSRIYSPPQPPPQLQSLHHKVVLTWEPTLKLIFCIIPCLCLFLPQRVLKIFAHKINIKKFIWIHLQATKVAQLKIRSKSGISLEITLNVFKCLMVSLVSLKFLYTLATAPFLFTLVGTLCVCEFAMVSGVNIFLCPPGRKGTFFLLHIQLHNHQKDLNPSLWLHYYGKVFSELENNTNNRKRLTIYGACNLTKWLFGILICFWFQIMSE